MHDSENNRRYVLLDRDGTIIFDRHYLSSPDGVELMPGAAVGLRRMRELGLGLVVITNQSGIGRGYFDTGQMEAIHDRMTSLLEAEGVQFDGIYHCPHHPEEHCPCRKPEPGLVEQAARELHFDPRRSFSFGDKACDVELGKRVGAATFLIGATSLDCSPDYRVKDLPEGARILKKLVTAG
ncbi:MAG: HAD family hydrolase [Armatimonadetes bacterium]|nr:HAD family hydrolase [Armatimonadota bacterium]